MQAAIYSALRRAHRNSPEYRLVLSLAKSEYFIPSKKGKQLRRVHFKCAYCGTKVVRKQCAVDHIAPVIDITGKTTYDEYVSRLFCGAKGLNVLCKPCHNAKTKTENAARRQLRNKK